MGKSSHGVWRSGSASSYSRQRQALQTEQRHGRSICFHFLMQHQRKTLIISPYPVLPADNGGSIRTFEIARGLAELDCSVTIIYIRPYASGNHFADTLEHRNLQILAVKHPFRLPYFLTGKPFPYHFIASFHPGYRFFIKRYLTTFDVYQFEHPNLADLLDGIPQNKTVIYNAHNVEYDYVASECSNRWIKTVVAKRIYNLEKKLIERCVRVLACSGNDKRRFMELYGTTDDRIQIIPNGIRKIALRSSVPEVSIVGNFARFSRFPQRALFSGGDSVHNVLAVSFIVNELAPQLRQDCAFVIKGLCGKKFERHRSENVFIDPQGANIGSCAALCTVGINPVSQGGGTNLKILDYLSHALPVISTDFGMRGYDGLRDFVSIRDLQDFVDELRNEQRFRCNVEKALEEYLWSNGALQVKKLYLSLSDKRVV